jgi:hypothetical protein
MRDDFSVPVKALLARRVAYKCSFSGCSAYTIGPAEAPDQAVSIGEAAHITAAAPGGPRYDPNLTADERSSYSNGIWMCKNHARLIDVDESFAADTLRTWKLGAETRARERLLLPGVGGKPALNLDLADFAPTAQINEGIGTVLQRSGIASAWGRSESGCVQDLLIEMARNAIEHGGASRIGLVVEPHRITLCDDGKSFDPVRSLSATEGKRSVGRQAVANIGSLHGLDLLVTYRHREGMNELDVVRVEGLPRGAGELLPCTLALGLQEARHLHLTRQNIDISSLRGCGDVAVLLPAYISISDVFMLAELLKAAFPGPLPQLHIVVTNVSDYVARFFTEALPSARLLRAT